MNASQATILETITAEDSVTITTDQWTCKIRTRRPQNRWEDVRHWDSHTRIYGGMNTFAPELTAAADENSLRTPVTEELKRTNPELAAETMREYRSLKTRACKQAASGLRDALALAAEAAALDLEVSAKFSAYAGCTCPCSSGHVANRRLTLNGNPVDIYFTAPRAEA